MSDLEQPSISNISPDVPERVAPETPAQEPVRATVLTRRPIPRTAKIAASAAVAVALVVGISSFVYLHPPTDRTVRVITAVVPFPAAIVGSDVITVNEYLKERDALNAYFKSSAEQSGTVPSETEIEANIMDTLVHKSAVNRLAEEAGVTIDEPRVDAFYEQALGGADPQEFADQLQSMFGWSTDEFRDRVVRPVVLAMQLGEKIGADVEVQNPRREQAQDAYDRLAKGEDFAAVAGDTSADSSATSGGDVGYVKVQDIPSEWSGTIGSLGIGAYSGVEEGTDAFMIFKVMDRTGSGDAAQVKLSIISVPKVTLEETVQEYLDSSRVWKLIGRA